MRTLPSPLRRLTALLALWPGLAGAQQLNAQRFQPSVDAATFLTVDDSEVGDQGIGGSLIFNYADDPFVFRYADEDRAELEVLGSVATTNLLAYANMSDFRVGLDVPLHMASTGYGVEGFRLFGDLALDGRYQLMDRDQDLLGLGVGARVSLPTGNGDAWLGDKNPGFTASVQATYGQRVVGAVNLGLRGYAGSASQIDDVKWGARMLFRGGVTVPVVDPLWVTAELGGERMFGSRGAPGATPIEALGSVRGRPTDNLVASLGFGAGLTQGIGAPDYRVVAGVSWVPGQETATDAYITAPTGSDRDGDGVADYRDLCPDQAEDRNGTADDDGCPDGGLTPTRLWARDPRGTQIAGATIELVSGPETGRWTMSDGELVRSLPAGRYRVQVVANDFHTKNAEVVVPEAPRHEAVISLDPVVPSGTLTVGVANAEGQPVEASLRLLGADGRIDTAQDGVGRGQIPAGTWEVVVSAPGYSPARRTISVEPGGASSIDVVLTGSRVRVTEDRVVILDKVFFEFDSAIIKPESFAILEEVAGAMLQHGEIALVEVQGHTDDQGADDYNRKLSAERAAAVRQVLINSGVSAARLSARGYGEDQPLQPGTSEEARAANRRVEFVIVRRQPIAEGSGQESP